MTTHENKGKGAGYLYVISFAMSAIPGVLVPVIPVYALHIGATQVALGLIGSIGAATSALFAILLGGLWDRLGKKRPIITGCVSYAILCFLYSFTTSPSQIVMLRSLEGLSWALFWPPVEALIAERISASSKKMVSNFGISWSSGQALGVFLSGFAFELNSLKDLFRLVSLSSLFLALTSLIWIKEVHKEKVKVREGVGKRTNVKSTAKIFLEYKEAWLSAIICAFGQGIIFAFYPAYAELKSIPGMMIGLYISLLMAGRTVAFWSFGRISMKKISLMGTALMSAGSFPIAITTSFPILIVSLFSVGFGAGLLYSKSFQRMATANTKKRGLYAGFFEGSMGIGYLSTVIAGALAERSLNAPYILSSAATACMFLWLTTHLDSI